MDLLFHTRPYELTAKAIFSCTRRGVVWISIERWNLATMRMLSWWVSSFDDILFCLLHAEAVEVGRWKDCKVHELFFYFFRLFCPLCFYPFASFLHCIWRACAQRMPCICMFMYHKLSCRRYWTISSDLQAEQCRACLVAARKRFQVLLRNCVLETFWVLSRRKFVLEVLIVLGGNRYVQLFLFSRWPPASLSRLANEKK